MSKPVNVACVLQEIQAELINASDREERLLRGNMVINQNLLALIDAASALAEVLQEVHDALTPLEGSQAATLNLTLSEPEPN